MIVSQAAGTAPRPDRGPAEYRLPEDRVSIRRPGFDTLAALAVLQAEIGEPHTADTHFGASRARYRSVSPFPLAILDYQHGRMWLAAGASTAPGSGSTRPCAAFLPMRRPGAASPQCTPRQASMRPPASCSPRSR